MWEYGHMGGLGLGWGFGWIFQILFWALLVGGVWYLLRGRENCCGSGQKGTDESAQEILKKRYAKGEIDKETFERIKKDLG